MFEDKTKETVEQSRNQSESMESWSKEKNQTNNNKNIGKQINLLNDKDLSKAKADSTAEK